jgi:hypothetical protein
LFVPGRRHEDFSRPFKVAARFLFCPAQLATENHFLELMPEASKT